MRSNGLDGAGVHAVRQRKSQGSIPTYAKWRRAGCHLCSTSFSTLMRRFVIKLLLSDDAPLRRHQEIEPSSNSFQIQTRCLASHQNDQNLKWPSVLGINF